MSIAQAMGLDPADVETGKKIADMSPEASGLVLAYLQKSADEQARLQEQIEQWRQEEIAQWRNRALRAEAELAAVRDNMSNLLYPSAEQITIYTRKD